jgi:hypothetical protein
VVEVCGFGVMVRLVCCRDGRRNAGRLAGDARHAQARIPRRRRTGGESLALLQRWAPYQAYFLTRDGVILRILELARDQEAFQKATRVRGVDEIEIEVRESTRFIGWLAVPALHRSGGHGQAARRGLSKRAGNDNV